MNKKILIIIGILVIAIILVGGVYLIDQIRSREQINQYSDWLDSGIAEWKPATCSPMKFGAVLGTASYNSGLYYSLDVMKKQLSVLEEIGVDIIRIDLNYDAWLYSGSSDETVRERGVERIRVYDAVVSQIRADGRELMIADACAEQYWKKTMTWEEFRAVFLERVETLAERYRPEYYVVVKEPYWYASYHSDKGFVKEEVTPEMWADLSEELCDIVKEVSPTTKTAVAEIPQFKETKEYFRRVKDIPNLDIIGIDLYAGGEIEHVTEVIREVRESGKEIWILETWLGAFPEKWPKMEEWRVLEAKWITLTVYYSQSNNIGGYLPFFSGRFTKKTSDGWQRTPSFYAYKSVIEEVRNNTGG